MTVTPFGIPMPRMLFPPMSNVTASSSGDLKGTAPERGFSERPDSLGSTAPSGTKATRPRFGSSSRMARRASSTWKLSSTPARISGVQKRLAESRSGSVMVKISAASSAWILRPSPGSRTARLARSMPLSTQRAFRTSISGPGTSISMAAFFSGNRSATFLLSLRSK